MRVSDKPPFPADYTWRGCLAHDAVGYQPKCTDCVADSLRGFTEGQLFNCKLGPRSQTRSMLMIHYEMPDVKIGVATETICGLRCGACNLDFHIGIMPRFCPACGVQFSEKRHFGEHR